MQIYLVGNSKQRRTQLRALKRTYEYVEQNAWYKAAYYCQGHLSKEGHNIPAIISLNH